MKKLAYFLTVMAATQLIAPASFAQAGLLDSCSADVTEFCAEVQPGEGRLAACLYAHTDLISDDCYAATEPTSLILERLFDRIQIVAESCEADITAYCSSVPAGGGQLYECLKTNRSALQPACAAALPAID